MSTTKDSSEEQKAKNKEYQRKWYLKNMSKQKAKVQANRERMRKENQDYIRELKESTPCKDCGEKYPFYVMDFDHLKDKSFGIGSSMGCYTLEKIKEEIDKCEIVCSNCHRKRTYRRALGS